MIRWLALQRRLSGDGGASIGNACPPMSDPPTPPGNVPTGSGNAGENIGLVGHGFGPDRGTVHVGSHSATVTAWTDTYVEITLPDQADFAVTTTITLTRTDGHTATLPAFLTDTASLAAHISSLSAAGGPAGLTVTITGTHFEAAQGTGGVTFHGVAAAVTSWADTTIVVTVPAQLVYPDTGNVVVTTGEGSISNGVSFETVPNPAITSLSAASARPSDDLALTGTHFLAAQGAGGVTLVGEPAQVVSWADTVIHVIVPDAPGLYPDAGSAIVTTDFGQVSNSKPFTIDFPLPTLFGLSAASGLPGDSLTLTGHDFEATQGTGGVKIDGTTATVTAWGDTSVTVTVPTRGSYPDTGNVILTTGHGNASGGLAFTTNSPTPVLGSLSVSHGHPGDSLTLTGSNFEASQGAGGVKIGGTTATVTAWAASSITVTVPTRGSYPNTGSVQVTTNGALTSNTLSYTTWNAYLLKGAGFNGTSQFLSGSASLTKTTGNPFSLCAWVKLTDKAGEYTLMSKFDYANAHREYLLAYEPGSDRFTFFTSRDGTVTTQVSRTAATFGSPTAGVWYFVCATWDGANLNISVNNGGVDSVAQAASFSGTAAAFALGNYGNAGVDGFLKGNLDSAALWNKALSGAEITALYNGGVGLAYQDLAFVTSGSLLTNLAGWWDLDEAAGASRLDASGGGITLTDHATVAQVTGIR